MSLLYDGEEIHIYDPIYNNSKPVYVTSEDAEESIAKAKLMQDMLDSAGYQLLKASLNEEITRHKDFLVNCQNKDAMMRTQATIKAYMSLDSFINKFILEGQLAIRNDGADNLD